MKKKLATIRVEEKQSYDTYQEGEKDHRQSKEKLTKIESAWERAQQELDQGTQKAIDEMEKEGFLRRDDLLNALLDEKELEKKKEWIEAYLDQSKEMQREIKALKNQLENRKKITREEVNHQEQLFQEGQKKFEEATRKRGAVEQAHQEIQRKHQRWKELSHRHKNLMQENRLLERLKLLLRGDRFVEFLAQEQIEFVAQQASEQLKMMTQNRYALEISSDGGFVIRDDANGSVRRPVASLSGGETFQASLALALALSAQIQLQGRYPLEFFFLDEGFGSLDAESLDVVIATLERLQLGNRSIGVISHVQELQQRLHRRLIVSQKDGILGGSQVRVEIG
ncbi:SbcC/MukB-like Walker B domain-containing protein [Heliorestis convoluta]|uniref:Nuclease SbcCD subunit C n=1 Tax=Heliorestis convoluta TaxID=356322 RepID=A0A5Q2N8P3_9FIRM|nr:SbcC/MukB-like Walker B domain-containing protein [Heliorestis convoluta]QGG48620.1 SMC family ATPase, putative [Heliorestis convoluta]